MITLDRLREDGLLATEINKFETRLWRQVRRDNLKTILMTSAVRGEGKSTTVAYLATSLGLYPGRRVLALDFDFRIPTMAAQFGLTVSTGIDRVMEGRASIADALVKTPLPGLHFAAPSAGGADPAMLTNTQALRAMFETLRETFDLILIDTPAIIPVADPTMLMPFADGVILAAMAGKTTEPHLRRAREICEGMDANLIGMVVGNVEEAAPDYLAGDYDYGYDRPSSGNDVGRGPAPVPPKSTSGRRRKPARRG